MSRPVRLTLHEAQEVNRLLSGPDKRGRLLSFQFRDLGEKDTGKRWSLKDVSDVLASMPNPRVVRSFEVWASPTAITLNVWSPSKMMTRQLVNHFRNFNRTLFHYKPAIHFPPVRAGSIIRVARVRPQRNPHHVISYGFGSSRGIEDLQGQDSPIVTILNNVPELPDGSLLVIQFLWRKHASRHWRWNPLSHVELAAFRGFDEESMEAKRRQMDTYYLDVRLLEIHNDARNEDAEFTRMLGSAFAVYDRQRGNRMVFDPLRRLRASRVVRFANAMVNRDLKPLRIRGPRTPHFSRDELAAFLHPPPAGAQIPFTLYYRIKDNESTDAYEAETRSLRNTIQARKAAVARRQGGDASSLGFSVQGKPRRLTAQEALRILQRHDADPEDEAP